MKRMIAIAVIAFLLTGCYATGHAGASVQSVKPSCAGSCAVFSSDGTGCERLHESASASCLKYFSLLCTHAPRNCMNQPLSQ